MSAWRDDVLDFWFGLPPAQHWTPDAALDREIAARFGELWAEQRQCPADLFLATPDDALAAVILFDQFPRNMFRDHAESFATDMLALAVAKGAIARGHDDRLAAPRRAFLYMPFQHSESIADQRQSLLLFAALDEGDMLAFARKHHDVIDRFGRFPHRNAMLGRASTAEEQAFGLTPPW